MFSKKPSFTNNLASSLRENSVWTTLAEKVTEVLNEMIDEPRWALSRVRESDVVQRSDWLTSPLGKGRVTLARRVRSNIDEANKTYDFEDFVEIQLENGEFVTLPVRVLQDRETMINQSANLGFDYFSNTLQDDDYARIVTYISKFWKLNGGDHFIRFMGFIKRSRLDIETLWTKSLGHPGDPIDNAIPANELDYYPILQRTSEYLPKVWNSPLFSAQGVDQALPNYYYPTSHVEVEYDIFESPNLDKLDVLSLFYLMAPIHLVLERFAATVYVKVDYKAATTPLLYTIQQRSLHITR